MYRIRPGKGPSMLGFFVGLVFLFIGVTMAIPNFGPFGVLWTLVALAITVFNGINAFGKKGVSTMTIEKMVDSGGDARDRLLRLNRLKADGLITEEEYQKRREEILKQL